jgi:hypothetical protein
MPITPNVLIRKLCHKMSLETYSTNTTEEDPVKE